MVLSTWWIRDSYAFQPTSSLRTATTKLENKSWGSSTTTSSASNTRVRLTRNSRRVLQMSFRGGRDSQNRDFYAILGIPRNADTKTIKSAYRKLAKQYHPDANPGKDTTEKFQEINRAYEVLTNDDLRAKYDRFGEAGIGTSAASDDAAAGNPFGAGGGFGQEVDLEDIFSTFFGGRGGGGGSGGFGTGRRQRGPIQGDDLRFDLELDFSTAIFGGEELVRIRHLEKCDTCDGSGVKPGSKIKTCSVCNGSGVTMQVTRTPLGNFQTQQTCSNCRGTGQIVEEYCGTCSGQGLLQKTKQIKVTIPAGVEDGNKLRVRGEGDAGPNGGPPGDLYIFLKVKDHPTFKRSGSEINSEATISYIDAILGASINIPVVDGEVTIKVPEGTEPNQKMRLKGKGAPKLGSPTQRGDHFVTIKVEIPKEISKEEEELVKKLRELQEKKKKSKKGFFDRVST